MAGRVRASASASALEQSGSRCNRSTTARRAGSASAVSVPSRSGTSALAQALHEPPLVAFGVFGAIAAVFPVFLAVVAGGRLVDDLGAGALGMPGVGVHVVDEHAQHLGVHAAEAARALGGQAAGAARFAAGVADEDQAVAGGELGVLDATPRAFAPEP